MTELCEQRSQGWNNFLSNSEKTDFPVKRAAGAFVLFIDSNPSFVALNLAEDTAQLSINSSNRPCDTSIIRSAPAHFGLFSPPPSSFKNIQLHFKAHSAFAEAITPDICPLRLTASIMWRKLHLGIPQQMITAQKAQSS